MKGDKDGEQWKFSYLVGKSVEFYKNFGKLFDSID